MVAPVTEMPKVTGAARAEPGRPDLSEEQRELLRSLKRSMAQAARGEGRSAQELLRELRMKRAAEENASTRDA